MPARAGVRSRSCCRPDGSWVEAGRGDGFTANARDPRYRIDYVFHTADLEASDAGVIRSEASDHFPVVVDLRLP